MSLVIRSLVIRVLVLSILASGSIKSLYAMRVRNAAASPKQTAVQKKQACWTEFQACWKNSRRCLEFDYFADKYIFSEDLLKSILPQRIDFTQWFNDFRTAIIDAACQLVDTKTIRNSGNKNVEKAYAYFLLDHHEAITIAVQNLSVRLRANVLFKNNPEKEKEFGQALELALSRVIFIVLNPTLLPQDVQKRFMPQNEVEVKLKAYDANIFNQVKNDLPDNKNTCAWVLYAKEFFVRSFLKRLGIEAVIVRAACNSNVLYELVKQLYCGVHFKKDDSHTIDTDAVLKIFFNQFNTTNYALDEIRSGLTGEIISNIHFTLEEKRACALLFDLLQSSDTLRESFNTVAADWHERSNLFQSVLLIISLTPGTIFGEMGPELMALSEQQCTMLCLIIEQVEEFVQHRLQDCQNSFLIGCAVRSLLNNAQHDISQLKVQIFKKLPLQIKDVDADTQFFNTCMQHDNFMQILSLVEQYNIIHNRSFQNPWLMRKKSLYNSRMQAVALLAACSAVVVGVIFFIQRKAGFKFLFKFSWPLKPKVV